MATIRQYSTDDGSIPFEDWFQSLDAGIAARIRTAVARMELGNLGDHKSVGGGVWEHRLHFGKGHRIYFGRDGDELIVLLMGGSKSRQQSDIAKAKEYWLDYKRRKRLQSGN